MARSANADSTPRFCGARGTAPNVGPMLDGANTYHYRRGGRVVASCTDPLLVRRAVACLKRARGGELSAQERAELDDLKLLESPAHHVATVGDPEAELGLLLHLAPDALRAVDCIAEQIEQRLGMPALSVWPLLIEYARRAHAVVCDDSGIRVALIAAQKLGWLAEQPPRSAGADDGPEGWSDVPPRCATRDDEAER